MKDYTDADVNADGRYTVITYEQEIHTLAYCQESSVN